MIHGRAVSTVRLEDTVESLPVILFTASAAVLLYVLAGYPLLLALLTKRRQKPVERRFEEKTVSVVMAVRDGEPWIVQKLRSILALNYPRDRMEIIVVSDGSEDHTDELVAGFAAQGVRLIRVPAGGKAASAERRCRRSEQRNSVFYGCAPTARPGLPAPPGVLLCRSSRGRCQR